MRKQSSGQGRAKKKKERGMVHRTTIHLLALCLHYDEPKKY